MESSNASDFYLFLLILPLRAGKRTVQFSVHPHWPYLRAQVIMQAAMVYNGWKQLRAVIRNARMSLI